MVLATFSACTIKKEGGMKESYPVKELPQMPKDESLIIYNLRNRAKYAAIKDKLNGIYRPNVMKHKDVENGNLSFEEFRKIFSDAYIEQYNK
jgi:hypothetical protein